jgi:hypothetical protein
MATRIRDLLIMLLPVEWGFTGIGRGADSPGPPGAPPPPRPPGPGDVNLEQLVEEIDLVDRSPLERWRLAALRRSTNSRPGWSPRSMN